MTGSKFASKLIFAPPPPGLHHRRIFSKSARSQYATEQQSPPPAAGSMTISVHAVGAAVYLVDAHSAAEQPTLLDINAGRTTPHALKPAAAPAAGVQGQQEGDDDAGVVHSDNVKGGSNASLGDAEGRQQTELLRMLAMYLDLGLDMKLEVGVLSLRLLLLLLPPAPNTALFVLALHEQHKVTNVAVLHPLYISSLHRHVLVMAS